MNRSTSPPLPSSSFLAAAAPSSSGMASSQIKNNKSMFLGHCDPDATLREWESRFDPHCRLPLASSTLSLHCDSRTTTMPAKTPKIYPSAMVTNDEGDEEDEHDRTPSPSVTTTTTMTTTSTTTDTNHTNASFMPKTFPEVLKDILNDEDNSDSIAWLPHGKSFVVLNRTKFVEQVLPRYLCKATKYTSFTRKLSRWNFTRVANGPDEGAWYNKFFCRDDKGSVLLREMKCAKRKKPGQPSSSSSLPLVETAVQQQQQQQQYPTDSPTLKPLSRKRQTSSSSASSSSSPALAEAPPQAPPPVHDEPLQEQPPPVDTAATTVSRKRLRPLKKRPVNVSLLTRSPPPPPAPGPVAARMPRSETTTTAFSLTWHAQLEQQIRQKKLELQKTNQQLQEQHRRQQQLLQLKSPDLSLQSLAQRYQFPDAAATAASFATESSSNGSGGLHPTSSHANNGNNNNGNTTTTTTTTRSVVTAAMQALLQSTNASPVQLLGGVGIQLTPQQQSTLLSRSLLRTSLGSNQRAPAPLGATSTTAAVHNQHHHKNLLNVFHAAQLAELQQQQQQQQNPSATNVST